MPAIEIGLIALSNNKNRHLFSKIIEITENSGDIKNTAVFQLMDNTNLICFLDEEAILHKDFLTKIVESHLQHPQVGCFYTDFIMNNLYQYLPSYDINKLHEINYIPDVFVVPTQVFKKGVRFDSNLQMLENYDLQKKISQNYMLFHLAEPLFYYES